MNQIKLLKWLEDFLFWLHNREHIHTVLHYIIIGTLLSNDYNYIFIQTQARNILHIYFKECENTMICFAIQLCQNILLLYSSTEVSDSFFSRTNSF